MSRLTVIAYTPNAKTAKITTNSHKDIKRMEKIILLRKEATLVEESNGQKIFEFPREWVKIRPNRILTSKQLEELRARGKALCAKKLNKSN